MKKKIIITRIEKWKKGIDSLWEEDLKEQRLGRKERVRSLLLGNSAELVIMLLMGAFIFYLASIQPLNAGPDEETRYLSCQYIYKHGTLPHGGDPEVIDKVWGISYAFKPMLSCILGGYLMRIVGIFNEDPFVLQMAARFINVLFGMGFAWYVMRIAKKRFYGIYRWFFSALVLLLPQITYLFSYVNNDGTALFSTAMIVYYWLEGIDNRWNKKACVGTAFGCAFCLMSYYNSYGYLLVSALLFAVTMLFQYQKLGRKRFGLIAKRGGFILSIVFLLTGWWFIRSAILYDGDFLGMRVVNEYAEIYAIQEYKPSVKQSLYEQGVSLKEMLAGEGYYWLRETYYSFIAFFGAQKYHLGVDIYQIHKHLLEAASVGWLSVGLKKVRENWKRCREPSAVKVKCEIVLLISFAAAIVLPVFLSVYYSYMEDFQPQGRYIMPMVIPLMYFGAKGIQSLITFLFKRRWAWVMMIPQFYAVFHVFYDAYINVCLPAFGVTVPFLNPVFPWLTNFRLFDIIRNVIIDSLFPG